MLVFPAACLAFSIIIGICVLGAFGERAGRRWSVAASSVGLLGGWLLLYCGSAFAVLLLSRVLVGASGGALSLLGVVTAAEYTSPESRALVQSVMSIVCPALGTSLGHVLGVVVHWRALCILGMVLTALHIVLPPLCVESPQWLAARGRFQDCEKAFRKLHGRSQKTEDELSLLIKMESNKQKRTNGLNVSRARVLLNVLKKPYFWGLMLTNAVIYLYYSAAGKAVFTNLATVMLEQMTGSADVLLFTIVVDGFIVLGTCASIVLIRKLSIRALLFSSGLAANVLLLVLSACLYCDNGEPYFQWVNVTLLAVYFVVVNAGPYPVMDVLLGEMFPLDIKLFCFALSTPALAATICSSMMLLPPLVELMGYHGLFLLNSVVAFVCLAYFWVRLPETKGKTLQEIELYFRSSALDAGAEAGAGGAARGDQSKTLI